MAEDRPKTIGRYEILSVLGKGAMGVVYKAVDPAIDRVVAIKTIRLSLPREELEFYEARFAQEIKTVGKLNHPNIVTIYDVGRTEDYAYMAMEFIDGPELKILMSGKPMDVATSVYLIAQIAEGLALAHARDIVHRDVKPSNIMIVFDDEDGMVAKITDFGIARAPSSAVKTVTGMILGSPRYMSPEQIVGKNVGARSDIFSLGVVLYEMLAGVAPFDADSVSSIMYKTVHAREEPLSHANPQVPAGLEAIVARALAKSMDERFPTMKEFARALRDVAKALSPPLAQAPAPRMPALPQNPEGEEESRHQLSPAFDSLAGTMRLAAMTDETPELKRIIQGKIAVSDVETTASMRMPSAEPFPVIPAAILGTLAVIAVVLALALAL